MTSLVEKQPACYSTKDANPSIGRWRRVEGGIYDSPAQSSWPLPFGTASLARCDKLWSEEHNWTDPRPYWEWQATECSLDDINEANFCGVVRERKGLLIVGDSLHRLLTTTVASILRAMPIKIFEKASGGDQWLACDGTFPIRFVRNDWLDVHQKPLATDHCEDRSGNPDELTCCKMFADDVTLAGYDVLVVNSGAHFLEAGQYGAMMQKASTTLSSSMRRLHGEGNATLVFRNTVPGHGDCNRRMFDGPVAKEEALRLIHLSPPKFNWPSLARRNEIATRIFSKDGWHVLDVYSPTLLRADSHVGGDDCLHYCLPGPGDHWARLLYNLLKEHPVAVAEGSDGAGRSSDEGAKAKRFEHEGDGKKLNFFQAGFRSPLHQFQIVLVIVGFSVMMCIRRRFCR